MTRGSFKTRDGCLVNYVDEGDGMPVLWQHGLGATQAQVAEVFPESSAVPSHHHGMPGPCRFGVGRT